MSRKRRQRGAPATGGTLSLEEAASKLGVSVDALLEALEESGVNTDGRRDELRDKLRLEATEVESYGRSIQQGRAEMRKRLAGFRDELDD